MSMTSTGDLRFQTGETETFRSSFDSRKESPSEAVVRVVAAVSGQDPAMMQTRLADVVNPDALDHLFAGAADTEQPLSTQATFDFAGCRVTVEDDGTVAVQIPRE